MFTYWMGYEVDGSSTTYNIVVPERKLVSEVMRYFLSLKLINRNSDISLTYSEEATNYLDNVRKSNNIRHENENYNSDDIEKLCDILEKPTTKSFYISTNCINPDKLYHEVRKELYNISRTRPGAENRVYDYKNPTVSPLYFGPDLGVILQISFGDREKELGDYEPEGLVFNKETLVSNLKGTHFTIDFGCGPSFIYEYAAYIVSKLAERFPEIGIDGGIDCAGGFVDGCTYSCSLYAYEKIRFPSSNIADIINRILQEGIVETQKRGGKYGNEITQCNNLFLFNLYNIDKSKDEHINANTKIVKGIVGEKKEYTPEEYEAFIGKVAKINRFDRIDFMHYSTCCIKIEDKYCALTCVKEDDGVCLEIRVVSELRDRFVENLSAAGIFIKR